MSDIDSEVVRMGYRVWVLLTPVVVLVRLLVFMEFTRVAFSDVAKISSNARSKVSSNVCSKVSSKVGSKVCSKVIKSVFV